MENWHVKKTLENEDGTCVIEIRASPDGKLFRYYENVWTEVGADELIYHPDGGHWSCSEMSGYYANLEECEREALARVQLHTNG